MYIGEVQLRTAVDDLRRTTHPFVGITFLACKRFGLPVGETVRVKLDTVTREHLRQHHRLDPESRYFFQPFKSPKSWVASNYASTGLQAVNTQTFGRAFLHERGSPEWGFAANYIDAIRSVVRKGPYQRTPLGAIAIWTAKERRWPQDTTLDDLVQFFLLRYNIAPNERKALFTSSASLETHLLTAQEKIPLLVRSDALNLKEMSYRIEPPPDADVPEGTLDGLEVSKVGPADQLKLEFGRRLTVLAGDNGLGKTFLLDVAWWAATGRWSTRPAAPIGRESAHAARISYQLLTDTGRRTCHSQFDPRLQTWVHQQEYPHVPAVYLYARADGAFSIGDDYRNEADEAPLNLTAEEVWDGKTGRMEGLVRDWVTWQLAAKEPFSLFERVLAHLSPSDLGTLGPAAPTRIPGDHRPIPVIEHPYGGIPVVHASAGVRRIMALAYVVTWAWQEHLLACDLRGMDPVRRVVLLVDEIDAHLHPFWQRSILPAILDIGRFLDDRATMQVVVSTHSPFVLASLEQGFDPSSDALYHLHLQDTEVMLTPEEFFKHGDVASWLTAPIFGLGYAGSADAERVLDRAMQLQLERSTDQVRIQQVSNELVEVLASDHPFWRRWTYFAEKVGVEL